jgi:hypothetical protein
MTARSNARAAKTVTSRELNFRCATEPSRILSIVVTLETGWSLSICKISRRIEPMKPSGLVAVRTTIFIDGPGFW